MGSWGLLGWGVGGLAVALWVAWLFQPPPWVAVVVCGLGVVIGWITGILVITAMERGDDDESK
jgi:hypothetical protein